MFVETSHRTKSIESSFAGTSLTLHDVEAENGDAWIAFVTDFAEIAAFC